MLWKYIKRHMPGYICGVLVLFGVDYLGLFIPQLTGELIEGLGGQNGLSAITFTRDDVLRNIISILAVGTGMALGRFGWRFFLFGSARKIEMEIRNDLFEHLTTLSGRYYNEHKTGDLMAYFTNDLNSLRSAIGPAIITAFDAVVMGAMVITKMILYVNLKLTVIACIPMLVILGGAIWYAVKVEPMYKVINDTFSDMSDRVQESFSGIRVIKSFVREDSENKAFEATNRKKKASVLRVAKANSVVWPTLEFLIGLCKLITVFLGGYMFYQKTISLAQFVAFNQYVSMLVWPMIAAGDSLNMISQGRAAVKRLNEIFDAKAEILDTGKDSGITELSGSFALNGLKFRYPGTESNVLDGVSVSVKQGETLAIMGKTGCGKTTVANLLLRLYDTDPGQITYDGHDIKDIPLDVLRSNVALVPQDNFLFSDSVQANIAFGTRKYIEFPDEKLSLAIINKSEDELNHYLDRKMSERCAKNDELNNDLEAVEEAAKTAVVHDNIMDFTNGYSTVVGERGVTMSGGQKQRSSIARALMKDAPLLILDDSLSAVDTDTEEKIIDNLKRVRNGKTNIIIAHRISTVRNADHIMILEGGKVAEYGTHDELIALGGSYARLYEKQQLEKMIEEAV